MTTMKIVSFSMNGSQFELSTHTRTVSQTGKKSKKKNFIVANRDKVQWLAMSKKNHVIAEFVFFFICFGFLALNDGGDVRNEHLHREQKPTKCAQKNRRILCAACLRWWSLYSLSSDQAMRNNTMYFIRCAWANGHWEFLYVHDSKWLWSRAPAHRIMASRLTMF